MDRAVGNAFSRGRLPPGSEKRGTALHPASRASACGVAGPVALVGLLLISACWKPAVRDEPPKTRPFTPYEFSTRYRVAVLRFDNKTGAAPNDQYLDRIQEGLVSRLLEGERLRLIERTQINSLLKEHEIAQKGIVDFNQAKKIGKMLSADALLLGTLAVVQSSMGETQSFGRTQSTYTVEVELNGRVIDVETSEVLASATVRAKAEGKETEFAGRREGNIDKPRLHEEAIQKSIAELARRISEQVPAKSPAP